MSLNIASLNSGSNGNCYYIGNDTDAILIDAGISCRETEKRMKRLGLQIKKLRAIFISHEHTDHINGVATLAGKYNLPVYITAETLYHSGIHIRQEQAYSFTEDMPVTFGNISVTGFSKFHDAADPYSFVVASGEIKVGVFTDIGRCCNNLKLHFKQCHAAFLEANYDEEMLATGKYPPHLKKRISGGNGHLSNTEALDLFLKHRPAFMSHLILSHLSKNNNHPDLVAQLFNSHAGNTEIIVASRNQESAVYTITAGMPKKQAVKEQLQLSLF